MTQGRSQIAGRTRSFDNYLCCSSIGMAPAAAARCNSGIMKESENSPGPCLQNPILIVKAPILLSLIEPLYRILSYMKLFAGNIAAPGAGLAKHPSNTTSSRLNPMLSPRMPGDPCISKTDWLPAPANPDLPRLARFDESCGRRRQGLQRHIFLEPCLPFARPS